MRDAGAKPPSPQPLVLAGHGLGPASVSALVTLGRLRARRGDPGQWAPLDDAHGACGAIGRAPSTRAGRGCESRGRVARRVAPRAWHETTQAMFELAQAQGVGWLMGELAYWRWRAGVEEEIPPARPSPTPSRSPAIGRAPRSSGRSSGCPYEAALALADADDDETLRRRSKSCSDSGARPAAAIVARRLRERGARGLPRGPRPQRGENPANLTARELEVLALSPRACATARSRSGCSSPRRPSPTTSPRSCASSTSARAARRAPPPCGSARRPR